MSRRQQVATEVGEEGSMTDRAHLRGYVTTLFDGPGQIF
jgi:hypothetical protein